MGGGEAGRIWGCGQAYLVLLRQFRCAVAFSGATLGTFVLNDAECLFLVSSVLSSSPVGDIFFPVYRANSCDRSSFVFFNFIFWVSR